MTDATITRAGAAMRDVVKVKQVYAGRIEAAPTSEQKRGLSDQATAEAMQAIQSHGISLQEYTQVMRLAQNDPQLRTRLLEAAGAPP